MIQLHDVQRPAWKMDNEEKPKKNCKDHYISRVQILMEDGEYCPYPVFTDEYPTRQAIQKVLDRLGLFAN